MDTTTQVVPVVHLVYIIALIAGMAACTWALMTYPLKLYKRASIRFSLSNIAIIFAVICSAARASSPSSIMWVMTDLAMIMALVFYQLAVSKLFRLPTYVSQMQFVLVCVLVTLIVDYTFTPPAYYISTVFYALAALIMMHTVRIKYLSLKHEFSPVVAQLLSAPDFLFTTLLYLKVLSAFVLPHDTIVRLFEHQYNNPFIMWGYITFTLMLNISGMATTISRMIMKMKDMAEHDQLTGLLNRRAIARELNGLWARQIREQRSFSVLMLDVDHFKDINDNLGHDAGDDAIVFIAKTLDTHTRESDYVARFGGEEFLLVLPDSTLEDARKVANKLCDYFAGNSWRMGEKPITVSIGVANSNQCDSVDKLLSKADRALYAAKHGGRNQVQYA